jgi:hypothetical protein
MTDAAPGHNSVAADELNPYPMEWRTLEMFPDYEISECGDVRRASASRSRHSGWRLRGYINSDGYLEYALINNMGEKQHIPAHRLVALAFIGQPPSGNHEVAHLNGSRVCNDFRILRWATRKENDHDTITHGTVRAGERNGRAKITEDDVRIIREEYFAIKRSRGGRRLSELDERYGLNRGQIIAIAKRQAWGHVQ